ncbi:MAG: hypothetical protein ABW213_07580, partial [Tardiphaga sp.]
VDHIGRQHQGSPQGSARRAASPYRVKIVRRECRRIRPNENEQAILGLRAPNCLLVEDWTAIGYPRPAP